MCIYFCSLHFMVHIISSMLFVSDSTIANINQLITWKSNDQERNHGWKVEGDQGLGPNTGVGIGYGTGSPPTAVRVRGYHLQKIYENSDAKYCILVTTCCEISCFLKTRKLGPRSWGTNTLLVPHLKVGDQSPPVLTVVAHIIMNDY